MFNYSYHKKRTELLNQEKKIYKFSSKEIKKAREANKPLIEIQGIEHLEMDQIEMIREEIRTLETRYYRMKTLEKSLPFPKYDEEEKWDRCRRTSEERVLSDIGITSVRTAIRKEWKEKYEPFFTLMMLGIGLIGALIGLVAVINK